MNTQHPKTIPAYSHDGATFTGDKDKAVQALADTGVHSASAFLTVTEARPYDANDFSTDTDVERILGLWSTDLADDMGQSNDCPFMGVSDAAKLELQTMLYTWVRDHVDLSDQLLIIQAPVRRELVAPSQSANDAACDLASQTGVFHG